MAQPGAAGYPSMSSPELRSEVKLAISPVISSKLDDTGGRNDSPRAPKKGFSFWIVFIALCVSLFLSALEMVAVSTALPTIVHDLKGSEDFIWVSSAYSLASTALLPASGGMAEIFGRRNTMLLALGTFFLGSALCGSAQSLNWLIAGRTIQGAGGGGILALSSIIVSDLVTLKERGVYNGFMGLTWGCAASIGPLIGGALAQGNRWRWLFYLNLPVSGVAAILVLSCLKLRTPPGTYREKFARMDWIGNAIITSSSSACVIALTWGGVTFPWISFHVLLPLILGLAGMGFFVFYEARFAKEPILPFSLLSNRTSLSGYVQNFINPIINISIIYFLPTYFQACKGASPIHGGIDILGLSLSLGPTLIVTGASITITKKYRQPLWLGWCFLTAAVGSMATLHADTPLSHSVVFSLLSGLGTGMLYSATYFPVLAPLPISENAHALAFFSFCRSFAAVWGVTVGTAVLQTQLTKRLPAEFLEQFPGGVELAYSAIPVIGTLSEPLQSQVQEAFAESIIVIWQVMTGICGIGIVASFFMKALPLHTQIDEKWGLEANGRASDEHTQASDFLETAN